MEPAEESGPALPNLTPRHRELVPTPCGPIKPCSELSFPVKIYFCVTILSLLSVIGLTIETLIRQTEEDFTISLIQLVGVGKKHTHCALKQSSAKVVINAMTTEGELHTSQKPLV